MLSPFVPYATPIREGQRAWMEMPTPVRAVGEMLAA